MQHKIFTKLLLCYLLFMMTSGKIFAQNLTIKGQITEAGNPITGAIVILINTGKGSVTDAMGNFRITDLTAGNYYLKVSFLGYEKIEKELFLTQNEELKISLKPSSINLSEVTISPNKSITQTEGISGVDKLLRPVNTAQDLLRLVPGLFIAQHAGGGKAEQIFLRGFDCDHGTDFNISVDGMPVNMVSHAHGQGYADFHFVIPETVDHLKVYKGTYTTRFGDFATSGTGEFFTKNAIDHNEVKTEAGMFDTYRALGMFKLLDKQHLFSKRKENAYVAGEYVFTNSYFDAKQKFNRYNIFGKYSAILNDKNFLSFSASTFFADWDASGQVPQRAVDDGTIDRFGSIDPSEGGRTNRTNINSNLTTTLNNNAVIKTKFTMSIIILISTLTSPFF